MDDLRLDSLLLYPRNTTPRKTLERDRSNCSTLLYINVNPTQGSKYSSMMPTFKITYCHYYAPIYLMSLMCNHLTRDV